PDAEVVAETAREHQLRDIFVADAGDVLQHGDARGNRPLAELDLADIVLRQHDLVRRAGLARPNQDHEALFAPHEHAVPQGPRQPAAMLDVDQARPVDDPRIEQRRDGIDQPRAAEALRRPLADRVHAEHAVVDDDAVDGAERGAHTVPDLRALERGP